MPRNGVNDQMVKSPLNNFFCCLTFEVSISENDCNNSTLLPHETVKFCSGALST